MKKKKKNTTTKHHSSSNKTTTISKRHASHMWHASYLQPMTQLHLRCHAHSCMIHMPER